MRDMIEQAADEVLEYMHGPCGLSIRYAMIRASQNWDVSIRKIAKELAARKQAKHCKRDPGWHEYKE